MHQTVVISPSVKIGKLNLHNFHKSHSCCSLVNPAIDPRLITLNRLLERSLQWQIIRVHHQKTRPPIFTRDQAVDYKNIALHTYRYWRRVSPANVPLLMELIWLMSRVLQLQCKNQYLAIIQHATATHFIAKQTNSVCRLVSPANTPSLIFRIWFSLRYLF